MNIVELYIDGKLCDTSKNFGVRLNRQLINPSELNTKDAQYSYSVTLPPTAANNEAFGYSILEETKNKFNRLYKAELYINSVRVFNGNFKLSEIGTQYKGNLYIPVSKSIKDIFGDTKLAENPEYRIEFKDFAEYVTKYNIEAENGPQMAIFPYALYGVLPKVPSKLDSNDYSSRDIWDDTVRMGIQDLPPSINPLLMLKHIFKTKGYKLGGTAFDDARLASLYMSYKNESDYVQPWNYGTQAQMRLGAMWSNRYNMREGYGGGIQLERGVYQTSLDGRDAFTTNILDATNTDVSVIEDRGGNINRMLLTDQYNRVWCNTQIRIPAAGFYKVELKGDLKIFDDKNNSWGDSGAGGTGIRFVSGRSDNESNDLSHIRYELKLLRDFGKGDFGLDAATVDGVFNRDNFAQNDIFNEDNTPKFYPQITTKNGLTNQTVLVDTAQNKNFVCGLTWGKIDNEYNPRDTGQVWASTSAAKPAFSWSRTVDVEAPRVAVYSPAFWEWGNLWGEADLPVGWSISNRFMINLRNAPQNHARRGWFGQSPYNPDWYGDGNINAVVWFEAGELLTLASTSDEGKMRENNHGGRWGYVTHEMHVDLSIMPFRVSPDWLKVDYRGNGTGTMDWNDPVDFDTDSIDLVKFLPIDVTTDDFIDNFCKAFNLKLSQTAVDAFRIDIKQTKTAVSPLYINLDGLASVKDRTNSSLGLPSIYKIGFTINQEEEGYVRTGEDGGGSFETGAIEGSVVEQKSNFSYNWFKNITKVETGGNVTLPLPIISKADVWADNMPYPEAMAKRFTSLASRFWYYDGLLNSLGANFRFNNSPISLAKVSNSLTGLITLNYRNETNTILNVFFTILVNSSSHYTELEGYLTPEQYERLDGSIMAMFNGDQYYVAEISGYDPLGRNKTKIKLIRKI